jgi:menaquinone-dependent protoporphyrinogen oxidase
MRVLVVYATRHGATAGIAERIASALGRRGIEVGLRAAHDRPEVADWDAVVVGSAAYTFHWLKDATEFVRRNRSELVSRPVWLFSSGPIGTDTTDAKGRDVREAAEPREFAEFRDAVHPRGEAVFFGAYDPEAKPIGFMERVTRLMPAARNALPAGDFRDWAAIDAWAGTIADELSPVPVG